MEMSAGKKKNFPNFLEQLVEDEMMLLFYMQ